MYYKYRVVINLKEQHQKDLNTTAVGRNPVAILYISVYQLSTLSGIFSCTFKVMALEDPLAPNNNLNFEC